MTSHFSITRPMAIAVLVLGASCRTTPLPQPSRPTDPRTIQFTWEKQVYRVQANVTHRERYYDGNQVTMSVLADWQISRANPKTGAFEPFPTLGGQALNAAMTVFVGPTKQFLHVSGGGSGGSMGASGIPGVAVASAIISSPPSNTDAPETVEAKAEVIIKFGPLTSHSDAALPGAELRIPYRWKITKDPSSPNGLWCDFMP